MPHMALPQLSLMNISLGLTAVGSFYSSRVKWVKLSPVLQIVWVAHREAPALWCLGKGSRNV